MLNSEGANGPLDHRDDCKETKKTCNRLYRKYAAPAVNTGTHPQDQVDKDQNNNSKDMKMIFIVLIQKQDGHTIYLHRRRVLPLHHLGGNHPTAGGQHGIGILHHGMSNRFLLKLQM